MSSKFGLLLLLFALLIFRPYQMHNSGMLYKGDDYSYFAHTSAIVAGEYPNYSKELFSSKGSRPLHSIGPTLLALPVTYCFSFLDRALNPEFFVTRTETNIKSSWTLYGFVLSSIIYFLLACCLLYLVIIKRFNASTALWSVLLIVLIQGVPLYAFRRPVFSHSFEFFLASCMIYLIYNVQNLKRKKINLSMIAITGALSALTYLVRENNIFIAIIFPLLFWHDKNVSLKDNVVNILSSYFVMAIFVFLFKIFPSMASESIAYHQHSEVRARLLNFNSLLFYFKRLLHITFGVDWGLFFTAPFVLVGLSWALVKKGSLNSKNYILLFMCLLNLFITCQWKTQGSWYGYRYLLFVTIPFLIVAFANFIDEILKKNKRIYLLTLVTIALLPMFSMLLFQGNDSNLTLSKVEQYFGVVGRGNNSYQIEVWKTILTTPISSCIAILKGGFMYFIYLMATIAGKLSSLPKALFVKYDGSGMVLMLRTFLIYIVTFVLPFVFLKINLKKEYVNETCDTDSLL